MTPADLARELRLTLAEGERAAEEYAAENGGNKLAYLVGYYEAELKNAASELERMARGDVAVRA